MYLAAHATGLSRSQLQRLIAEGRVQLNESAAKSSDRVQPGDRVRLEVPPAEPSDVVAEAIPIAVLYEDRDLIVVDKVAGMVVHPAAGVHSGTLVNALLSHCEDIEGVGGVARPGIVHRLDKGTSGVMVVAKNDLTLAGLAKQFSERTIGRRYLALAWGRIEPEASTIETLYGRNPKDRKRFTGRVIKGRRAVTHYQRLETFDACALLALRLETGRTHQIRVHLAERGHPVIGDPVYGRSRANQAPVRLRSALAKVDRQLLHAEVLSFVHPRTGQTHEFRSSLPEDFAEVLAVLRKATA